MADIIKFLKEQKVKETGAFSKGVNKGLNIAISAIKNPEICPTIEQPQWISCAERLPQEYEPPGTLCDIVQVLLKDGDVTVGFCNRFMRMWFYLPKLGIEFVHDSFDQTPVIAWQPLSQPPKENE